jgi:wyosine [tRNA(Phe)-imidazoG37] synthetase (radical SAM superfamily)
MPNKRTHLYGPVPSRRLGYSLGVDLLPFKTCSMDCVYCQLGSAGSTVIRRREFVPAAGILAEIKSALDLHPEIDAITFSGSGEPTLQAGIGKIIRGIKRLTDIPVVVLTNGAALAHSSVRRELRQADIVVPSLDAADPEVFRRVNRPHESLVLNDIIAGLERFRREFKGRLWLEIMLVKGVNDAPAHLRALKRAAAGIKPDKIQLNTVVRPPAERSARPLDRVELERIRAFFGPKAEIIAGFKKKGRKTGSDDISRAVLNTVPRRPVTAADIALALGRPQETIAGPLARLLAEGRIRAVGHKGLIYFKKR